jgi:hypothetical protein
MGKLDQHADRIKELYAKTGTVLETRAQLLLLGIEVSYESLRQWLKRNPDKLPALRTGAGKPRSARTQQMFGFLPQNTKWMPSAGMHPQFFLMFHANTTDATKDGYLATALLKYGVETTLNTLETTELPLSRMRDLCDLDLYVLAYLLGRHAPLIGRSEEDFVELTRAVTPMAVALKDVILKRNAIQVGELRDVLIEAEANCRKAVESRRKYPEGTADRAGDKVSADASGV